MKNLLLAVLTTILLTSCSHVQANSKYEIKAPTNGKHHAIIKISRKKGTCSAFVISDSYALTAGHCMEHTEHFLKNDYVDKMKDSDKKLVQLKKIQSNVIKYCFHFQILCNSIAADIQLDIDAELEAREKAKKFKASVFNVYDINGKDTKIKAVAYAKNDRRDYGYIRGDFRNFNKLEVQHNFNIKKGDKFQVCGFPGGNPPAICSEFTHEKIETFKLVGESAFVPGMSGGPAIDKTGKVVGITAHVRGNKHYLEQAIGLD